MANEKSEDVVQIEHHVPGRFTVEFHSIPGVGTCCTITGETGELSAALHAVAELLSNEKHFPARALSAA